MVVRHRENCANAEEKLLLRYKTPGCIRGSGDTFGHVQCVKCGIHCRIGGSDFPTQIECRSIVEAQACRRRHHRSFEESDNSKPDNGSVHSSIECQGKSFGSNDTEKTHREQQSRGSPNDSPCDLPTMQNDRDHEPEDVRQHARTVLSNLLISFHRSRNASSDRPASSAHRSAAM